MRIAVIGPGDPDSFADNIVDSSTAMGHDAIALGPALPRPRSRIANRAVLVAHSAPAGQAMLERGIIRRCREHSPDLVISVESLMPSTVSALQRNGAHVILWYPDHVGNLGRHLMFAATYDAMFFKQRSLVARGRQLLGKDVFHLPEACNPRWHRPIGDGASVPHIVVAGHMYVWRVELLERMVAAGLPVSLYGPPFPKWIAAPSLRPLHRGRYLAREDKAETFRAAGVVLNNLYPAEIDGYNCRLYEATACGATVLTESRPELSDFFEPGSEVTTYDSFDELVDKAKWLLANPVEARALGDRASTRAHAEHTYEKRLTTIFDTVA